MNNINKQIKEALSRFRDRFCSTDGMTLDVDEFKDPKETEKFEQFLESELSQIARENEKKIEIIREQAYRRGYDAARWKYKTKDELENTLKQSKERKV